MPQMAPLNWLSLMIYFILILIMFNIMNHFSFNYKIKKTIKKINKSNPNWKW